MGIEIWTSIAEGGPAEWRAEAQFWKEAGVSHITVNNARERAHHKRIQGSSFSDHVSGIERYREAGADLIFVDGIRTLDELDIYSEELALKGIPCLYNGGLVAAEDAQRMGFKIQILAGLSLAAVFKSATAAMQELNASGITRQTVAQFGPPEEGETVNDILGVPEVYELEQRYDIKGETAQ